MTVTSKVASSLSHLGRHQAVSYSAVELGFPHATNQLNWNQLRSLFSIHLLKPNLWDLGPGICIFNQQCLTVWKPGGHRWAGSWACSIATPVPARSLGACKTAALTRPGFCRRPPTAVGSTILIPRSRWRANPVQSQCSRMILTVMLQAFGHNHRMLDLKGAPAPDTRKWGTALWEKGSY